MNTGYLYVPQSMADGLANPRVSTRVVLYTRRVKVSEIARGDGYEANTGEKITPLVRCTGTMSSGQLRRTLQSLGRVGNVCKRRRQPQYWRATLTVPLAVISHIVN